MARLEFPALSINVDLKQRIGGSIALHSLEVLACTGAEGQLLMPKGKGRGFLRPSQDHDKSRAPYLQPLLSTPEQRLAQSWHHGPSEVIGREVRQLMESENSAVSPLGEKKSHNGTDGGKHQSNPRLALICFVLHHAGSIIEHCYYIARPISSLKSVPQGLNRQIASRSARAHSPRLCCSGYLVETGSQLS